MSSNAVSILRMRTGNSARAASPTYIGAQLSHNLASLSPPPWPLQLKSVFVLASSVLTRPPAPLPPQVRDRVSQVQKQLKRHEHALKDKLAKDAADLEQSLCELEH